MAEKLEAQKRWAAGIARVLALYGFLADAYVLEFFTDNLWNLLPVTWQAALADLSPPTLAALLLEKTRPVGVSYSSVWPLSLLAFRATAHTLAFPRRPRGSQAQVSSAARLEEFRQNPLQSSKLHPLFRKHVKPKKQHEIRRLGQVVKKLSALTGCLRVVDVGSGQDHLARYLSFGLSLSVTAIESNPLHVGRAMKFDQELVQALKKEQAREGQTPEDISFQEPSHVVGWVDASAPWQEFLCLRKPAKDEKGTPEVKDGLSGPAQRNCQTSFPRNNREPEEKHQTECGGETLASPGPTSPLPENQLLLTGLHACGDLSVSLLRHFVRCPCVVGITSVACCYMKLSTAEDSPQNTPSSSSPPEYGYPLSAWVSSLPGHKLSYKAREGACHAIEDYILRLKKESATLRTHCFRAMLETVIRATDPTKKRLGVKSISKAHMLRFEEYARLGLARVGLDPNTPLNQRAVASMLAQQQKVVAFFSLALLLAPLVETLILLDRAIYLKEQGFHCRLIPLFDPTVSPRNLVLVAAKTDLHATLSSMRTED